jgi:hypothetical protein
VEKKPKKECENLDDDDGKKIGVAQLSVVQRGDRSMLRRRRKERKNIFLSSPLVFFLNVPPTI